MLFFPLWKSIFIWYLFLLSEELLSISTRFFVLQADLLEMNPSGFFFKSEKVFYFALILNCFLPAGCRSLRWKISFSLSVLKTLLPFLFYLHCFWWVICWHLFLILSPLLVFWLMLRFYFYQWFWKILLFSPLV